VRYAREERKIGSSEERHKIWEFSALLLFLTS